MLRERWRGGGIMHCFTGDAAQAREALDLGFHLSFGGVLTFPKAEAVRAGGAHHARRPPAGGDRLPLSGARSASRQTQRAGVHGGDRAPPGGGARRTPEEIAELTTAQFRAAVFARRSGPRQRLNWLTYMNLGKLGQALTAREIFDLIQDDLEQVEKKITVESVASVDAVTAIGQYLQSSGGKRLRPALAAALRQAGRARQDTRAIPPSNWARWWS